MGHIGLTPQSIHQLGGYKVQGRTPQEAARLLSEAQALEKAGVFSIVLECVPFALARQITKALRIPTIGIGAGVYCDGQVLVMHDVLGLYDQLQPRFVRRFVSLREPILKAIHRYKRSDFSPAQVGSILSVMEIAGKVKNHDLLYRLS
jgi:3-methyl-2-oxobutanoate hydroxymethyltransferase